MKILIDINHPAHVHYFKNFIHEMEKRGHEFRVVNRDSKMINSLLDAYGIKHAIRNKRPAKKGTISSLKYLAGIVSKLIKESLRFKPDLYLGFASSGCAITAWLFRKPSVLIDDTEHNSMNHSLYKPFCSSVLTPFYFEKDLGPKQIRFQAFVEQLYLHSKYFKRDTGVIEKLGLVPQEYAIVRYISYDAHHDLKVNPMPEMQKQEFIENLSKRIRVVLSHESEACDEYYKLFMLNHAPEDMHEIEANAKFIVSEGATMASEGFVTGVPFAYINPLKVGYINYASENFPEMAYNGTSIEHLGRFVTNNLEGDINPDAFREELEKMTINPTDLLIWFVANYPESAHIMKQDPEYQLRFAITPPSVYGLESMICALRQIFMVNAHEKDSNIHRTSGSVSFLQECNCKAKE